MHVTLTSWKPVRITVLQVSMSLFFCTVYSIYIAYVLWCYFGIWKWIKCTHCVILFTHISYWRVERKIIFMWSLCTSRRLTAPTCCMSLQCLITYIHTSSVSVAGLAQASSLVSTGRCAVAGLARASSLVSTVRCTGIAGLARASSLVSTVRWAKAGYRDDAPWWPNLIEFKITSLPLARGEFAFSWLVLRSTGNLFGGVRGRGSNLLTRHTCSTEIGRVLSLNVMSPADYSCLFSFIKYYSLYSYCS